MWWLTGLWHDVWTDSDWFERISFMGIGLLIVALIVGLVPIFTCGSGPPCPRHQHQVQTGTVMMPMMIGKTIIIEPIPQYACERNK